MALRHSLYPAGKASVLAPAVTSIAIRTPCRSSTRASDISGMLCIAFKKCCPALTHMDHQWRAAVLHLCLNPAGRMPVAHPGCPMDHFQTLVNRSPGDLWMRCIGTISSGVRIFSPWGWVPRAGKLQQGMRNCHRGKYPFPGIQAGFVQKNSPSSYTTTPSMMTRDGNTPSCPSNGVQPHLLCSRPGSIGTDRFG
jgi:hypothetical protein